MLRLEWWTKQPPGTSRESIPPSLFWIELTHDADALHAASLPPANAVVGAVSHWHDRPIAADSGSRRGAPYLRPDPGVQGSAVRDLLLGRPGACTSDCDHDTNERNGRRYDMGRDLDGGRE